MSSTTPAHEPLTARSRSAALLDAAVAVAALAGTWTQLAHGDPGAGGLPPGWGPHVPDLGRAELDLAGVALAAGTALPLVARRRAPLAVFTATAGASVLLAALGYPLDLTLGLAVALYGLAAGSGPCRPRAQSNALVVATVVTLLVAYLAAAGTAQGRFPSTQLLHSGLAWAVAWFAGERTRLRREHIIDLHKRALRVEREAERERRLAAAEERARIARDLHDSAGHAISVIAVRAGAARLRHDQDPQRSRAALTDIEELARRTADDIDQIVGSLRRDDPTDDTVEPPLGLASLDTLLARHRSAGLQVTLHTSGTPRPVTAAADQAAYRILQEALTNATRHGTGTVHIAVAYDRSTIQLTVTNPASSSQPAAASPRPGGGHGLIGMRERATLLGGDLHAERVNGTFQVHARIPFRPRHP